MQLAWEMLEAARVIWERAGEARHLSELADVHLTLGEARAAAAYRCYVRTALMEGAMAAS
jgi:hypothetical protein